MRTFEGAGRAREMSQRGSGYGRRVKAGCCWVVAAAASALVGCSSGDSTGGGRSDAYDSRLGVNSSPRLASDNGPIPKGGGVYKLGEPYQVAGRWYYPRPEPAYSQTGVASWYGPGFHGRRTSNGEIFDMNALTAAHKTLPLPCYAYVTNLDNGRTILVRINDRGPYVDDRLIDLSKASAQALGYGGAGLVRVRVRYAGDAPLNGNDGRERQYLASQSWNALGPRMAQSSPNWSESYSPAAPAATSGGWTPFTFRAGYGQRSGLGGTP